MKVDMSPEAVAARLNLMAELCELGNSLKGLANRPGEKPSGNPAKRALEIREAIRTTFIDQWGSIGISEKERISGEYGRYITLAYRILVGSRAESELLDLLLQVETERSELRSRRRERPEFVVQRLLALDVSLETAPAGSSNE